MSNLTEDVERKHPLQHKPGVFKFRCDCGEIITFASNSKTYPMLINRTFPGPQIIVGDCPVCGAKHWKGTTQP